MKEGRIEIDGFPGYFISSNGEVFSNRRGQIICLKSEKTRSGYLRASLQKDGRRKRVLVHRLVAGVFVRGEGTEVNHKNGNKADNRASNLEWSTRSKNILHAYENGWINVRRGENSHLSKLTYNDVLEIREALKAPYRGIVKALGKKYGVTPEAISAIRHEKNWRTEALAAEHGVFVGE